jgi:ribosomal protein S18 acetylase RimI-like enzyme
MTEFKFTLLKKINSKKLIAINKLIPQLDKNSDCLSKKDLKRIIKQKQVKIFVAYPKNNPNQIVGILFFVYFQTLVGKRGRIEDLVVDENSRGMGIGKKLVNKSLIGSKKLNIKIVELTSRPARIEANKLYQKLNFNKKETNVYQYIIKKI